MAGGRRGLELRTAFGADGPALAELLAAAGRPLSPTVLTDRLEALRAEPGACLLAWEWGPPSGLILLNWRRTLASDRPVARIEHLFVDPEQRRRGVGRLLLKAGSQAARSAGCGEIEIVTPPNDAALTAFCLATGFLSVEGVCRRPLRKGAHAPEG